MGSGLLYLSIVVLWGAVLVPMWLKRLTHNELGSIAKFNESMSLLGSVPQREIPIYQALTPTQIAAIRRRRTVLALSAVTFFGTAISIVTGIWLLMVVPAVLLFGFFVAAWRAINLNPDLVEQPKQKRLNVSRADLAAQAKQWEAAPTVIPNRVVGEKVDGFGSQEMLEMATSQVEAEQQEVVTEPEVLVQESEVAQDRKTATG